MKFFLSKMIYRIVCGNGDHTSQFDEQLRIVYAESMEEAIIRIREIGEKESVTFNKEDQQLVC